MYWELELPVTVYKYYFFHKEHLANLDWSMKSVWMLLLFFWFCFPFLKNNFGCILIKFMADKLLKWCFLMTGKLYLNQQSLISLWELNSIQIVHALNTAKRYLWKGCYVLFICSLVQSNWTRHIWIIRNQIIMVWKKSPNFYSNIRITPFLAPHLWAELAQTKFPGKKVWTEDNTLKQLSMVHKFSVRAVCLLMGHLAMAQTGSASFVLWESCFTLKQWNTTYSRFCWGN